MYFCDYDNCNNDINSLTNENELSYINNFLHPYNSYKKVSITINSYNKIEAFVEKSYNSDIIEKNNKKLDEIIDEILDENMTDKEKIISILSEIRPEFDFTEEGLNFIEQGMLDSFDVVTLVDTLDTEFNIVIDGIDILPENFCSIDSIITLLGKYGIK